MKTRKVLALILALTMVLSTFSMSLAETDDAVTVAAPVTFNDVNGHWASDAIYKWSDYGVINGYAGLFRPNDPISRGEMACILDNMMDYQVATKNTFTDLIDGQFYTEAILKANAAGIIKGDGSTVRPTDKISREEAAVMLGRAFAVNESTSGTAKFNDAASISTWAKGFVIGMEAKGYLKGSNNNFQPKTKITRAEIVTIINNIVKAYYIEAGTYSEDVAGTAVIKVTGITLKGVTVSENLIIAEGVGQGEVTLDSVTVKGNTVVRGGGENSIEIIGNSNITTIRIERIGDTVRIVVSDGSTVTEMEVAAGEEIIITGTVGTLDIAAPNATITANDANIGSANITGSNTNLIVGSDSRVGTVTSSGNNTSISGTGTVTNVVLNEGANNSSVTTPNTQTTVGSGVTGTTGGGGTAISGGSTVKNNPVGNGITGVSPGSGNSGHSSVAVSSMTVIGTNGAIAIVNHETLQMTVNVSPSNASNKNITWSVENGTGAGTIDINGVFTATGVGTVTVKATAQDGSGKVGSIVITISDCVVTDESSLKDAISTVADGTVVLVRGTVDLAVSAGTSHFGGTNVAGLIVDKNITIMGVDEDASITCSLVVGTNNVTAIWMKQGELSNLKIKRPAGDGPNLLVGGVFLSGDAKIINCTIENFRTGVEAYGNNEIIGNIINGNRTGVIYISKESTIPIVNISNNSIFDNRTFGIVFNDGGTYGGPPNYVGKIYDAGYDIIISENKIYDNWFAEFETRNLNELTINHNYWGDQGPIFIYDYVSETLHPNDAGGSIITTKPDRPAGGIYQPYHSTSRTRSTTLTYMNFTAGDLIINNYYTNETLNTIANYSKPEKYIAVSPGQSIQTAIDAAADGDTILVVEGIYTLINQIEIDKGITLKGQGDVILEFDDHKSAFNVDSGTEDVTLENLIVEGEYTDPTHYSAYGSSYGVFVTRNTTGKLTIKNSEMNGFWYGLLSDSEVPAAGLQNNKNSVEINNCVFDDNKHKAVYVERTDSIIISNSVFTNNANYTATTSQWYTLVAVDINLKYNDYTEAKMLNNIFEDNGGLVIQAPPELDKAAYTTALGIKARDDGGYAASPATLASLIITSNTFSMNIHDVQIGEPGKNNTSPTPTNINLSSNKFKGTNNIDTVKYSIANALSGVELDASNNYWGINPNFAEIISGSINVYPYYTDEAMTISQSL